jgi:subtilisin-like proprotein convertase family protein
MRTRKHLLKLLTLAVLVFASVAGIIPMRTLGSAPRALTTQIELDKEALHARMKELQENIENLLMIYGKANSQDVRAQLDAAQQEFDSISNQLGGDRPVATAFKQDEEQNPIGKFPQLAAMAPIGCPTTTTTFSASPNIRIPTILTAGTRTTTITVSGLDTSIWDVDAITNLTHTACADLDITLKSPAGTIVTLTTDNGGNLDNVFNGTRWDDQANPGGQVPYSSNNGLVTDHAYVNNTLASPLVPEEGLGAFIGESPNGTWTLTISDDALGDIGNLASWSLIITTLGANTITTQAVFPSTDPFPAVISNTCLNGPVTSTVNVAGTGQHVGRVKLRVEISHFNPDDMDITLTSPQGTVMTVTTDNGNILAPNSFDGTIFDRNANPGGQVPYPNCLVVFPCNQELTTDRVYALAGPAPMLVSEESLAAFNGEDPNGVWTLKIVDDSCNLLIGVIRAWSLDITTATCCSISCPADIIQGNSTNQCGANVTFSPTDNGFCAAVTCTPPSGGFFPKGTTTVDCGTSAGPGCSFSVTVNDTEPPTITCPADVTQPADAGLCSAVVNYPAPTVSDNCPNVGMPVCTPASGTVFQKGTTTVNCSVTDTASLTSNCSFSVTINDTQPPAFTCPASFAVSNTPGQCTGVATYVTPNATDNCPNVGVVNCIPASGSAFSKGATTVTCTAQDASGNMGSCTFTVTVNETQPPALTCPTSFAVSNTPGQCTGVATYVTPNATDNCPNVGAVNCTPASGSAFSKGATAVTCTAQDASGNMSSCTFTVTVNDTQPPAIACPANIIKGTDPNQCSAVVTYPNATATDNCAGAGVPVCTPSSNTVFPKGTTTVNCTVSDASGNTARCAFSVTVNDTQPPTIVCPPNITAVIPTSCNTTTVVTYPDPTAADNCPGVSLSCTPPSGTAFPVGTTSVSCKATDSSGNISLCSFTTIIFDVRLQDDNNPGIVILFNSFTGDFRFCCGGTTFVGKGTAIRKGCVATLWYNSPTVRVIASVDAGGPNKGSASLQTPPGSIKCTIYDRDITNDTSLCQ